MGTDPTVKTKVHDHHSNEINIAELIELIFESKWKIVIGCFICALVVGIYTHLQPQQYESKTLVLISPPIADEIESGNSNSKISEVEVSSFEVSTYEFLAKSDDLMIDLAEQLKTQLSYEQLATISNDGSTHALASNLAATLGVELLTAGSKTPLLALSYQSSQESLPLLIVNAWSQLFLERNRGLSSNVTDDFYQSVVQQYDKSKENLESKEYELTEVDAASSELKRLSTEQLFKQSQLDSSLNQYQRLQTELEQKTQDLAFVKSILGELEIEDSWIGYTSDSSVLIQSETSQIRKNLTALTKSIKLLSQDSVKVVSRNEELSDSLRIKQSSERMLFEVETQLTQKKLRLRNTDQLIDKYRVESTALKEKVDSLAMVRDAIQESLNENEAMLTTRKAIGNDVLWDHTLANRTLELKKQDLFEKYHLFSEEVNPIHQSLGMSLANNETKLKLFTNRSVYLKEEIARLEIYSQSLRDQVYSLLKKESLLTNKHKNQMLSLNLKKDRDYFGIELQLRLKRQTFEEYKNQYSKFKTSEEKLVRELIELKASTDYHKRNYDNWRERLSLLRTKLDSLELRKRRIQRDVAVYQESFNRFAKLREEARIARQQADGDIQIVSRSAISTPIEKHLVRRVLISIIASFMTIVTMVFIVDLLRKYKRSQYV